MGRITKQFSNIWPTFRRVSIRHITGWHPGTLMWSSHCSPFVLVGSLGYHLDSNRATPTSLIPPWIFQRLKPGHNGGFTFGGETPWKPMETPRWMTGSSAGATFASFSSTGNQPWQPAVGLPELFEYHQIPGWGLGNSPGQCRGRPCHSIIAGWWFGCHFFNFPINIGFVIIPIDFHIFQRGSNHQPVIV